jgi:hypothetical protein
MKFSLDTRNTAQAIAEGRAVIVRLPTRRDHDPYRPGWIVMIGELEEVAQ